MEKDVEPALGEAQAGLLLAPTLHAGEFGMKEALFSIRP